MRVNLQVKEGVFKSERGGTGGRGRGRGDWSRSALEAASLFSDFALNIFLNGSTWAIAGVALLS